MALSLGGVLSRRQVEEAVCGVNQNWALPPVWPQTVIQPWASSSQVSLLRSGAILIQFICRGDPPRKQTGPVLSWDRAKRWCQFTLLLSPSNPGVLGLCPPCAPSPGGQNHAFPTPLCAEIQFFLPIPVGKGWLKDGVGQLRHPSGTGSACWFLWVWVFHSSQANPFLTLTGGWLAQVQVPGWPRSSGMTMDGWTVWAALLALFVLLLQAAQLTWALHVRRGKLGSMSLLPAPGPAAAARSQAGLWVEGSRPVLQARPLMSCCVSADP